MKKEGRAVCREMRQPAARTKHHGLWWNVPAAEVGPVVFQNIGPGRGIEPGLFGTLTKFCLILRDTH